MNLLDRITKAIQMRDAKLRDHGRVLLAPTVNLKGAKPTSAELLIYGPIGMDMWGDGIGAAEFAAAVSALPKSVTTLNLRINSPGGSIFDGFAMMNTLRRFEGTVKASIDGLAASAATLLVNASNTAEMSDPGMFMIHNAQGIAFGDHVELRETADVLEQLSCQVAELYARQTGHELAAIHEMMHAETWLSASEALEHGFVDAIVDGAADPEPEARATPAARMALHRSRLELRRRLQTASARG